MEEQRLADRRLHRFRQERLGDEIGRLRPLAGEQLFRIGGDEDHRNIEAVEDLADRIDARTAFAEIDVGEDQPRLVSEARA